MTILILEQCQTSEAQCSDVITYLVSEVGRNITDGRSTQKREKKGVTN